MEQTRLKRRIFNYLNENIVRGNFPGAVFMVNCRGETIARGAVGFSSFIPQLIEMEEDMVFDCASLTKVVVTAPSIVNLISERKIGLDQCIEDFFPLSRYGVKYKIYINQLLTHTAGLKAWIPIYCYTANKEECVEVILKYGIRDEPGKNVEYSCLGYILLGKIVERITGRRLRDYAREFIFKPLEMESANFKPGFGETDDESNQFLKNRKVVPTEFGNAYELAMAKHQGHPEPLIPMRDYLIWGEANDLNCWFLGGDSGNSGLFASAEDILKFARALISKNQKEDHSGPPFLSYLDMMTTNFTAGMEEHRGIGWALASSGKTSAGKRLSDSSFGHNGFTGVSLWIDPKKELIAILLTNRIHPKVKDVDMRSIREGFHSLIMENLRI